MAEKVGLAVEAAVVEVGLPAELVGWAAVAL
jgi:hypothetical protein